MGDMDSSNNRLRVLLINPFFIYSDNLESYDFSRVKNKVQFIESPLGIGSISAYVRRYLPDVIIEVFDANAMAVDEILKSKKVDMEYLYKKVEEHIKCFSPDVIGVSGLFEFIGYMVHRFAYLCKKVKPDSIVVLGGAYASFSYKRALLNKNIDFIIMTEGEKGFKQLLEYLLGKLKIEEVGNLIYMKKNDNEIIINERAECIDLADMPWPDRSNFFMDSYATRSRNAAFKLFPERQSRVASVSCSRGCPYLCGFCSTKRLWGASIRYRSLNSIFEEIRYLIEKYKINTFFFPDDNIAYNRDFFRSFLKRLIKLRESYDIKWISGGFQATKLDEEIIKLCVESGLVFFPVAFESGSARVLRLLKKPLTIEQAEKFMHIFRDAAPQAYIYGGWITGLPFETKEDFELTYNFAKKIDLDWAAFYCYQPYPGTPVYEECVEKGYISLMQDNVVASNAITNNAISTENFSAEDVISSNYCANLDINFVNNRNLCGRGVKKYAYADFLDIVTVYPDHVFGYYCLAEFSKLENNIPEWKRYMKLTVEAKKRTDYFDKFIEDFGINFDEAINKT